MVTTRGPQSQSRAPARGSVREVYRDLALPIAAMAVIVTLSNILVQFPFNVAGLEDFFTWGAFTYPVAFLVTDLTNRRYGPARARRVVYLGFALAVVLSVIASTPRIALASGTAFLVAQLLDVFIFDQLRRETWWMAPLSSTVLGSVIDTGLFFALAFAGTGLPWLGWAMGDLLVKLALAGVLLLVYGAMVSGIRDISALEAD